MNRAPIISTTAARREPERFGPLGLSDIKSSSGQQSCQTVRHPATRPPRAPRLAFMPPANLVKRSRSSRRDDLVRAGARGRSEEHTSELQSLTNLVCRLLLAKKKNTHDDRPRY